MTREMTREEAIKNIKEHCYFASLLPQAKEALDVAIKVLEPCEDEYIKVPKKALKYRTAGMVAYNAEWLKNHFDIERAVICGEQEPCENAISRQVISDYVGSHIQEINTGYGDLNKHTNEILRMIVDYIESMPPVTPQYTDAEIQNIQELEQAEIRKAYELGKAEKQKTGHWIVVSDGYGDSAYICECSECKDTVWVYKDADRKWSYCPNCGAKMIEPQKSESKE